MRHALFGLSLLAVLGSTMAAARGDDPDDYELAGYSQPSDDSWESDVVDDDYAFPDPRYDWELSEGPADLNEFFAAPEFGSYFQADALFLSRMHSSRQTIAVTLPPGSRAVLNSKDASLTDNYQVGALLTYGRRLDQVSAVELTYFGFNSWNNSTQVTGNANLSLPGTLPLITQDYIFADRIKFDYNSSLYNVEGNYTQTISGLKLLGGFRYLRLNEALDINSTVNALASSSDYQVWVKNNLIGGQVGLGFDWQWDRLTVDLLGKFGVYANLAEQNTLMKDINNTFIRRNFGDESVVTSVLGEIGINGSYRIFDWLSFRAGYRFLWINNVAAAPDQLNFSSTPGSGASVTARNHLYLHGVNVGLEARW
jgi:hypothetical protein